MSLLLTYWSVPVERSNSVPPRIPVVKARRLRHASGGRARTRACGGPALDQMRLDESHPAGRGAPVASTLEQLDGELAHRLPRLIDGGQRDVPHRGERRVVVADQRHVIGDGDAALFQGRHGTDRSHVVTGEDGRRELLLREELLPAAVAALLGEVTVGDRRLESMPPHRSEVSRPPVARTGTRLRVDVRDAGMPELQQVPDDELPGELVVVDDHV